MKLLKLFMIAALVSVFTGCACSTHSTSQVASLAEHNVYFAFDSAELDESSKRVLQEDYAALKNTTGTVDVTGYADERGDREYNQTLSEARAKRVANYLISLGLDENRVRTDGAGKINSSAQPESWAKNRRVSIAAG